MKPPETIYLQCYDEAGDLLNLVHDDVTWCVDQINENDAVYVVIPPPSALPPEQRLWIAQQYAMNRAQYENRVKDECLKALIEALRSYANEHTWLPFARKAEGVIWEIERRLAQLEEEETE